MKFLADKRIRMVDFGINEGVAVWQLVCMQAV